MLFYVVRHSERVDEADLAGWKAHVQTYQGRRDALYFANDPPITSPQGEEFALSAASIVRGLVAEDGRPVKIFCSRMRRAVQTAAPIAKALGVPVHLSAGLANVISSVSKSAGKFQFQNFLEVEADCPGVEFIDADDRLPSSWVEAVQHVVAEHGRDHAVVIVGHRETVRGIAGRLVATPYCCIAEFESNASPDPAAAMPKVSPAVNGASCARPPGPLRQRPVTTGLAKSTTNKKERGPQLYPLVRVMDCHGFAVNLERKSASSTHSKK